MNRVVAICDREESYVKNLIKYIKKKQTLPFQVQGFTRKEYFLDFLHKASVDAALIAEEFLEEEMERRLNGKLILLKEAEKLKEDMDFYQMPQICKYRAAQEILEEMEHFLTNGKGGEEGRRKRNRRTGRLTGVYSPVGRCQKTLFAVTLGQIRAEDTGTLYINMELFSGFRQLLHKEYALDILDMLYYFRESKTKMLEQMRCARQKLNRLHYIPPCCAPADMNAVSAEEWREWIQFIRQESSYENLVLDLGDGIQGSEEILYLCDKVYMPVRTDFVSQCKIEDYRGYLQMAGYGSVWEKTEQIKLPAPSGRNSTERYFEFQYEEEFGKAVRQIIGGI